MSTLQVALAIAGGVVLAGLVAHGAWSSRKNTPRQAEPAPGTPRDPDFEESAHACKAPQPCRSSLLKRLLRCPLWSRSKAKPPCKTP